MSDFNESHDLKILVRVPTRYKNPEILSCVDFFLTIKNLCFMDTNVFEVSINELLQL